MVPGCRHGVEFLWLISGWGIFFIIFKNLWPLGCCNGWIFGIQMHLLDFKTSMKCVIWIIVGCTKNLVFLSISTEILSL